MGFYGANAVSSNANLIIPNAFLYHFGVLTSSAHMAWMRTVCGRRNSDYRYSKEFVYNHLPWPDGTSGTGGTSRTEIQRTAQAILVARKKYEGASFAELNGEKMYLFADLVAAHQANDAAVMRTYGFPEGLAESEIVVRLLAL